jgi:aspartate/methionine/tyrosine aminotransferase
MLGLPSLRQAVAENQKRFHDLEVDWQREVLVTSGATEALSDAFFGLLNPGDEAIVIEPVYDSYGVILRRAGVTPVPVSLRPPHWELPREALEKAITSKTRALVINTPMNPIGKIFSASDLRFVADLLLKHDLIAIADEVYEHLTFDGRKHRTLFAYPEVRDRVVRIGSAGKTFSVTGWKVGYVTADAKLLGPISRLQERRDFVIRGLQEIGFEVGEVDATYFAVADASPFDREGDDFAFCERLTREAGVTAVPISAFYGERQVKSHIRFCFAKRSETLAEALTRLARWRDRPAA